MSKLDKIAQSSTGKVSISFVDDTGNKVTVLIEPDLDFVQVSTFVNGAEYQQGILTPFEAISK